MPKMDYQTAFLRLETIANLLEEGNLPLEESLKLYEEGNTIANELRRTLSSAEQKLTVLRAEEDAND